MSYQTKPDLKSLSRRCAGYGILDCRCGGDLCVCGLDGEECLGCPDCAASEEEPADDNSCYTCKGSGYGPETGFCLTCGGSGQERRAVPEDDGDNWDYDR